LPLVLPFSFQSNEIKESPNQISFKTKIEMEKNISQKAIKKEGNDIRSQSKNILKLDCINDYKTFSKSISSLMVRVEELTSLIEVETLQNLSEFGLPDKVSLAGKNSKRNSVKISIEEKKNLNQFILKKKKTSIQNENSEDIISEEDSPINHRNHIKRFLKNGLNQINHL